MNREYSGTSPATDIPLIPKFGMRMRLPADMTHIAYYGRRCDVRWFEIGSEKQTIHIDGHQPLCIRVWDYGEEDLEGARHPQDITRGRFVNLNIDQNIHGVGGIDTWGRRTLPQYTIPGDHPHHLSFVLCKINAD